MADKKATAPGVASAVVRPTAASAVGSRGAPPAAAAKPKSVARTMLKPAWFQISPCAHLRGDQAEEINQRVGTPLSEPIKSLIAPNFGFYPGGDAGKFNYHLEAFVAKRHEEVKAPITAAGQNTVFQSAGAPSAAAPASAGPRPVVFAFTTHGQPGTGQFVDTPWRPRDGKTVRDRVFWTAPDLWRQHTKTIPWGPERTPKKIIAFRGLRSIIDELPNGTTVYLVFAQCYGAHFADAMRAEIRTNPLTNKTIRLYVPRLSYGVTWRVKGDNKSVATIATHAQLAEWVGATFADRTADDGRR